MIEEWILGQPSAQASTPVSKRVVYDANTAGRREVLNLYYLRGANARKAFVQFEDSRNLFRLNVMTGGLKIIVRSSEASTLSNWRPYNDGGNHPVYGNIYLLHCSDDAPCLTYFVLIDRDRNGSIDEWHEMSVDDIKITYEPNKWDRSSWY